MSTFERTAINYLNEILSQNTKIVHTGNTLSETFAIIIIIIIIITLIIIIKIIITNKALLTNS